MSPSQLSTEEALLGQRSSGPHPDSCLRQTASPPLIAPVYPTRTSSLNAPNYRQEWKQRAAQTDSPTTPTSGLTLDDVKDLRASLELVPDREPSTQSPPSSCAPQEREYTLRSRHPALGKRTSDRQGKTASWFEAFAPAWSEASDPGISSSTAQRGKRCFGSVAIQDEGRTTDEVSAAQQGRLVSSESLRANELEEGVAESAFSARVAEEVLEHCEADEEVTAVAEAVQTTVQRVKAREITIGSTQGRCSYEAEPSDAWAETSGGF